MSFWLVFLAVLAGGFVLGLLGTLLLVGAAYLVFRKNWPRISAVISPLLGMVSAFGYHPPEDPTP